MSPNARPDRDGSSLNARTRTTLTVAWCAFLSASVSTMVFFAFVDPSPVVAVLKPTGTLPDRTALYSLGFLFFFGVCTLAASLTAWLINSHPRDAS